MLNDSINLYFKLYVVSGTLNIGINAFPCHSTIMSHLMAEDYILNSGGVKRFLKDAE